MKLDINHDARSSLQAPATIVTIATIIDLAGQSLLDTYVCGACGGVYEPPQTIEIVEMTPWYILLFNSEFNIQAEHPMQAPLKPHA